MRLFVSPHILRLIDLALDEDDLGFDATSASFFAGVQTTAHLLAKQDLVLAGQDVVRAVFQRVDPTVVWEFNEPDGAPIKDRVVFARASGDAMSLLRGERTALNFLQRISGVATQTAQYVAALDGSNTAIADTRKTIPGWRELDKYGVRMGGGKNHRFALSGGIMVKDNHIAAAGSIKAAVDAVKKVAPHTLKIEVEIDREGQVDDAINSGADIIMLDNMSNEQMTRCIAKIREADARIVIEASGNVTLERLPELGRLGVDVISSGALTHSVPAVDISMNIDL